MGTVTHPLPNTLTDFAPRRRIGNFFHSHKLFTATLFAGAIISLGTKTAVNARNSFDAEYREITQTPPNLKADLIVVETGSKGRIRYGLELWQHNKNDNPNLNQKILITGVDQVYAGKSTLKVLTQLCLGEGMAKDQIEALLSHAKLNDIFFGFAAMDTPGNALETQKFLETFPAKSILVVTGQNHIPRSHLEMEKVFGEKIAISFSAALHCSHASLAQRWKEILETDWRQHGGPSIRGGRHYIPPKAGQAMAAVELPRPQTAPAMQAAPPRQPPF